MTQHNFQVDLGGVVEILSRNLYSGPRVFVRELMQNGVDAITARLSIEPEAPQRIRCVTSGDELRVIDTGVGLTFDEAQSLLATIGASSKRDELGLARSDYLGQFGIGLLSCFMVSPTIEVYSRSARVLDAQVIRWVGRENGTWDVSVADETYIPSELEGPGTCIVLRALPGEKYFEYPILRELLSYYGRYLPVQITVERASSTEQAEFLSAEQFPWEMPAPHAQRWCMDNFGFVPFDMIPIDIPVAGLKGMAFVLATGAAPGQAMRHFVHLRRMLVTKKSTELLPEWAYFVRVIVDAEHLKPTASREQLFDDDLLDQTRVEIGEHIRQWLSDLAIHDPQNFHAFTSLHLNGLKTLALNDAPTRALVASTVQYQTSLGWKTLDEVMREYGAIRFTRTDNEFRTLEPVARANDLCIVNAGFAFDEELLGQLALDRPEARISALDPMDVLGALKPLGLAEEAAYLAFVDAAQQALTGQDLQVEVRSFAPVTMPVLFLPDSDMMGQAIEDSQKAAALGAFAGLIEAIQGAGSGVSERKSRLIFNAQASILHELAAHVQNRDVFDAAVRGFYVQSLLAGRHPMNTQARSWSSTVFTSLIAHSLESRP